MMTKNRNVRLDEELDARYAEFCRRTYRAEAHTIRAILQIFLADGFDAAERRLAAGVWEPTPAEKAHAEYILTGKQSGSKRRKRGSA